MSSRMSTYGDKQVYLAGRLFAALVHYGAADERAYGTVCARPMLMVQYLTRAMETGHVDDLAPIMEIMSVESAFATGVTLTTRDQSDFALGYYSQLAELRTGLLVSVGTRGITHDPEPELNSTWTLRVDSELKEWAKANGGDRFVRSLLREERSRRERTHEWRQRQKNR